jgi:hypothetical protein
LTLLEFVAGNPWWSVVLLIAGGFAVGQALSAPVVAYRKWTKAPGICPRCHGTGRDP